MGALGHVIREDGFAEIRLWTAQIDFISGEITGEVFSKQFAKKESDEALCVL